MAKNIKRLTLFVLILTMALALTGCELPSWIGGDDEVVDKINETVDEITWGTIDQYDVFATVDAQLVSDFETTFANVDGLEFAETKDRDITYGDEVAYVKVDMKLLNGTTEEFSGLAEIYLTKSTSWSVDYIIADLTDSIQ